MRLGKPRHLACVLGVCAWRCGLLTMLAILIKNFVHYTFGKVDIPNKRNFRTLVGHHIITRHYGASRRCVMTFKFVCCLECCDVQNSAKYDVTFRTLFASNLD